jgi:hypothetical protein
MDELRELLELKDGITFLEYVASDVGQLQTEAEAEGKKEEATAALHLLDTFLCSQSGEWALTAWIDLLSNVRGAVKKKKLNEKVGVCGRVLPKLIKALMARIHASEKLYKIIRTSDDKNSGGAWLDS